MSRLERNYAIVTLLLAAGVSLSATDEGDVVDPTGFNGAALIVQMILISMLAFFLYRHRHVLMEHARALSGPMPVALMAFLSVLWSIDPSISFRRSILLMSVTLFGYFVGVMLDPAALGRLYLRAVGLMVVLSVLFIVLLPKFGISHGVHAGDWRGAFYHKNRFGEMMALAVITFGIAPPVRISILRRWSFTLVALALLYKSHASTNQAAIPIIIAAQAVWLFLMLRRKIVTGLLLVGYPIVAAIIGVLVSYAGVIFGLFGKDSSLTGRNLLWAGAWEAIKLRPWLGYGYVAFWLQQGGTTILIQERTSFKTIHAHNGFLNVMLHIGIVGLVLVLIFLVRALVLVVREGRRTGSAQSRWFFSFILLLIIANLTESQIIDPYFFLWMTLIAGFTSFSIQRSQGLGLTETAEESMLNQARMIPAAS